MVGDVSSPGSGRRPSYKISRDDILAHAYAQCCSNKGAPGVDGQDFVDIEAYGVERWLAELALALRRETYRPEPIRRVFIPKANGKLRPLTLIKLLPRSGGIRPRPPAPWQSMCDKTLTGVADRGTFLEVINPRA